MGSVLGLVPIYRADCRCRLLDRSLVSFAGGQLVQMVGDSELVRYAEAGSIGVLFLTFCRWDLHSRLVARAPADFAAARGAHPPGVCEDIQADVGRAVGSIFYLRAGVYLRIHRDGQFAGLRTLEDRRVFRGPCAHSRTDRRCTLRQQYCDQRHVRTGASSDWEAPESARSPAPLL